METGLSTSFFRSRKPTENDWYQIKDAGFSCIELAYGNYDEAADYDKILGEYKNGLTSQGLYFRSFHIPYGLETDVTELDKSKRKNIYELVKSLTYIAANRGTQITVLHPSWEPVYDYEREERIKFGNEMIAKISEYNDSLGIKLAVECLPRTCIGHNSNEMLRLTDGTTAGICVDVNHLTKEAPADFIRKTGKKIITTHLSDNDGIDEKHWLLGHGVIDFDDVFKALKETGFSNPYVFETRNDALKDPHLITESAKKWIEV